jgi:hypothetical protein
VLDRERRGDYLGKTVQVVPHITDAIQDWIQRVAHIPVDGRDGVPGAQKLLCSFSWIQRVDSSWQYYSMIRE